MRDLDTEHALLIDAVRAAGPIALEFFHGEVTHWEKEPGDPVSEADHAVNDLLEERLRGARPDYGWLSEETEDSPERLQASRVWVVDPIDGTKAFLQDRPEFTICVALVENGRPLTAAVYNPATEELFEARDGRGARLNGVPIRVNEGDEFGTARMLSGKRMFERAGWKHPPKGMTFATINSIAYRMSLVACGRYDACVSLNNKSDWDIAAAELVVREAGGQVSTARDEPFTYNLPKAHHPSIVAAGPDLHASLIDFLQSVKRPVGARW